MRNSTADWFSVAARAAGAIGLALLAGSCSPQNATRLPELSSLPRQILSTEEQKKAVEDLQARREAHRAEAEEEIKSTRKP